MTNCTNARQQCLQVLPIIHIAPGTRIRLSFDQTTYKRYIYLGKFSRVINEQSNVLYHESVSQDGLCFVQSFFDYIGCCLDVVEETVGSAISEYKYCKTFYGSLQVNNDVLRNVSKSCGCDGDQLTMRPKVYIKTETHKIALLLGIFLLQHNVYIVTANRTLNPPGRSIRCVENWHVRALILPKSTDSMKRAMSSASLSPSAMSVWSLF